MTVKDPQDIQRMLTRLRASAQFQAMITRTNFAVAASTLLTLDLNSRSEDIRHRVAAQWCEVMAKGRWRRRLIERRGYAALDRVYFEFEFAHDRKAFEGWRKTRGW